MTGSQDERRDRNQQATASAAGTAFGGVMAGPVGSIIGSWLGPKLVPLVKGVWAELSESARQRQTDVLFWIYRVEPVHQVAQIPRPGAWS